jgi:NAD+ kinase
MINRSIVVSDKRTVTVQMIQNARRNAYISVDGGKAIRMNMGDTAIIKASSLETRLVRLNDRSFYDVLNTKFNNK